jgi:hypothetical protein
MHMFWMHGVRKGVKTEFIVHLVLLSITQGTITAVTVRTLDLTYLPGKSALRI